MNYNIKWFEVEVWRGKAQDECPEYLKPNLPPEVIAKRELRSPSMEEKRIKTGLILILALLSSLRGVLLNGFLCTVFSRPMILLNFNV